MSKARKRAIGNGLFAFGCDDLMGVRCDGYDGFDGSEKIRSFSGEKGRGTIRRSYAGHQNGRAWNNGVGIKMCEERKGGKGCCEPEIAACWFVPC